MTKDQKRQLAIQRELAQFDEISKSFDILIADAKQLTDDMRASGRRLSRIQRETEINREIEDFEYALKSKVNVSLRPFENVIPLHREN